MPPPDPSVPPGGSYVSRNSQPGGTPQCECVSGIQALDAYTSNEAKYLAPGQTFLSAERHYDVHAVSVYDGVVFLQVIDDDRMPVFHPRALFDVVDERVPEDWICNIFPEGPVQLVLGPPFLAKDLASYDGMIDQRGPQVAEFWRRVGSTGQPSK